MNKKTKGKLSILTHILLLFIIIFLVQFFIREYVDFHVKRDLLEAIQQGGKNPAENILEYLTISAISTFLYLFIVRILDRRS